MRRFGILLVSFLLIFAHVANARGQFTEPGVEKFKVPVEAPDFTLKGLGGSKVSLKELRGKYYSSDVPESL
jgi:hypothetical protein